MAEAIQIRGLRDLQRAFAASDKTLTKELRGALTDAARPVSTTAESLATAAITSGQIDWSSMRIGITRSSVYVAPRRRRTVGTPRSKFAKLLLDRSMVPALEQNREEVTRRLDEMLGTVAKAWERG